MQHTAVPYRYSQNTKANELLQKTAGASLDVDVPRDIITLAVPSGGWGGTSKPGGNITRTHIRVCLPFETACTSKSATLRAYNQVRSTTFLECWITGSTS